MKRKRRIKVGKGKREGKVAAKMEGDETKSAERKDD